MRRAALGLSLAGLVLALVLVARQDPGNIARLLVSAGAGLILAALAHVLPMLLNARAWQWVLPPATRPSLAAMTRVVWLRESVNALLPVARVGGELLAYRVLTWTRLSPAFAAAGLVVDMAVSLLSQLVFALVGVCALLVRGSDAALLGQIATALGVLGALTAVLIVAQQRRMFERIALLVGRMFVGRLASAVTASKRIDRAMLAIYRQRMAVVRCFAWQLAGWLAGSSEIGLALYFLGHPVGVLEAVAIEGVIQAVSSAAFVIPGALGVQEAGFILVGGLLGIDAPVALALAGARRIRDLVIFVPGLLAWNLLERARIRIAPRSTSGDTGNTAASTLRP